MMVNDSTAVVQIRLPHAVVVQLVLVVTIWIILIQS